MGLALLVVASLVRQWRTAAWRRPLELKIGDDGSCVLTDKERGEARRYRLVRAALHPGLVRLLLQADGRRGTRMLLIPRDAVEPRAYQALRAAVHQRRLPVRDQAAA